MKRSPLRRKTPLQNTRPARLPAKRAKPRRSERIRDREHLARVHDLPCWASLSVLGHACAGSIEADHQGARPSGRKANDDTAVPLCTLAHRQRTDWSGPWRSWDKLQMQAWLAAGIAWTRAALHRQGGPAP